LNHLISQLVKKVTSSEEDKHKVEKYMQLQTFEGWKTHQEYLLYLRGLMAEDLLSDRFTSLKPIEKDVCQRAYAMVDQMVLFLLDPLAKARKLNVIAAHNQKMEATLRGATGKR
jgi:hypothetical protein